MIDNSKIPNISSSMRSSWRSCGRKVFYRYVAGIEPLKRSKALIMGSAYHAGLEAWRRGSDLNQAMGVAVDQFCEATIGMLTGEETEQSANQLRAYLEGYFIHFGQYDRDNGLHFVEQQMFEEGEGETGFADSLYRDVKGDYYIIEDKTAGRFEDPDVMNLSLKLNDQLISYVLALTTRGILVTSCLYRQVKKTQTSQTKKETPADYAKRIRDLYTAPEAKGELYRVFEISFTQAELARWRLQKDRQNLEILSHFDLGEIDQWPMNPSNCVGAYGKCDYLTLCARGCDSSQREFKPNGKEPLDNGSYQRKIWTGEVQSNTATNSSSAPSGSGQQSGALVAGKAVSPHLPPF